MVSAVSYKEYCLIDAKNFIERFICSDTYSKTQTNKLAILIFVIAIIILIIVTILKFRKKHFPKKTRLGK